MLFANTCTQTTSKTADELKDNSRGIIFRQRPKGSRKSCWHESHFTLSTNQRASVRTCERYFTTTKWHGSVSFRNHCQKYTVRRADRDGGKFLRSLHVYTGRKKINQYVNLNITKWTYESENPCFCPRRFTPGMNWWEFELSGAAPLNALRGKVCSIERNYSSLP